MIVKINSIFGQHPYKTVINDGETCIIKGLNVL